MAIHRYECEECGEIEPFFSHEKIECVCGSEKMKKLINMPLKAKSCDKVDKLHDVHMERGIEEDLKKRNIKHNNDTIDDFIDKHGEKQAKEMGYLVSDDGGKTWRKRTDFDTRTLNAQNKATKK